MALQKRPTFIGLDRLVELHLTALELLDDTLEFLQRIFERERGNVLRQCGFFSQIRLAYVGLILGVGGTAKM